MNNLTLNNYGVSKLETREMKAVDGGFLPYFPIDAVLAVADFWENTAVPAIEKLVNS